MASETLMKMESILADVVAKPLPRTIAELQEVADGDPDNPAPYLAMAIVNGFYGISHRDLGPITKNLNQAEERLSGGDDELESQFSQHLFTALSGDVHLMQLQRRPGGNTSPETEKVFELALACRKSIRALSRLVRDFEETILPGVIYAALRTLSQTSVPGSKEYRLGLDMLSRMMRENQKITDLAGFFLLYGFRKGRNYSSAIQVGEFLEERNPRSVMVKKALGSSHYFSGDFKEAEKYFNEAITLAPNDPGGYVCAAQVLDRQGELEEARVMLDKAISLDTSGEMTAVTTVTNSRLELRSRFAPELKKIGWL